MANIVTIPERLIPYPLDLEIHSKTSFPPVYSKQYEDGSRVIVASLYNDGNSFPVLSTDIIYFCGTKNGQKGILASSADVSDYLFGIDSEGNIIYQIRPNDTNTDTSYEAEFRVIDIDGHTRATPVFKMFINKSALQDSTPVVVESGSALANLSEIPKIKSDYEAATHENTDIAVVNLRQDMVYADNNITLTDTIPLDAYLFNGHDSTYYATTEQLAAMTNKKIGQTDCTAELLAQIAGTAEINAIPADFSIVSRQFKKPMMIGIASKNIFDSSDITVGVLVAYAWGGLSTNANCSASNYIPVLSNTAYRVSGTTQQGAFYDANKTYISGLVDMSSFTTPTNAVYVRLTMLNTEVSSVQMEQGTEITPYASYKPSLDLETIREMIPMSKLDNKIITGTFKNLFDKTKITAGRLPQYNTGNLYPLAGCNASDYISVNPNTPYKLSGTKQQGAFYDVNKVYISGLVDMSSFTTPINASYVRLTVLDAELDSTQLEIGSVATKYESYGLRIDCDTVRGIDSQVEITVKKDGSGTFSSVVEAVNYTNGLINACSIYIYDGEYDLLSELGGQTFLDNVRSEYGERQGLNLTRDNIDMYGIGRVVLSYMIPDETVTYVQSSCTSGINLYKSNRIENIEFIVKNCRYACHDETNGGNPYLKRYVKNCRFTHLGNLSGLWNSPSVYGGGAGGGSQYDFINCQFITNAHSQAWSFHTNYNQKPSHFNVDGCVGIVNSPSGNSFNCTYYGTGQEGRTVFNIKNCTGNGIVRKAAEIEGSNDHIDVYVNGYNQITV